MRGWAVRIVVLVVSALVTGAVVLALGSRGDLQRAEDRVDTAWARLRPALDERFRLLGAAGAAAAGRLGEPPALLAELNPALSSWQEGAGRPVEEQAALANRLEGFAARLEALVDATPRLRSSEEVTDALAAVEEADPAATRDQYNGVVASYERVRGGFPRRLVAGALGFDTRRTLEVPV